MDDILSEERRSFLEPLIWSNSTSNNGEKVISTVVVRFATTDPTSLQPSGQGWLEVSKSVYFVREADRGNSRFLTTQAFSKEIFTTYLMEQTWKADDQPVAQLLLKGPDDFDKFTSAIHYQMMLYTEPNKNPESLRVKKVNEVFGSDTNNPTTTAHEMDMIYTAKIFGSGAILLFL